MVKKVKHSIRVVLVVLLAGVAGLSFTPLLPSTQSKPNDELHTVRPKPPAQPTPQIGMPVTLKIPALGLTAPIEPVGVSSKGEMDVPTEIHQVGWYHSSSRPGLPGSAVLAGHLDNNGAPAIFWRLHELAVGAKVEVIDEFNHTFRFTVTDMQKVTPVQAPKEKIFGKSEQSQLRLITCSGMWDRVRQDYSHRLIVYATSE